MPPESLRAARAHCNPGRIESRSRPRICGFRQWAMLNFPRVRTARSHIHAPIDCNLHSRLLALDEISITPGQSICQFWGRGRRSITPRVGNRKVEPCSFPLHREGRHSQRDVGRACGMANKSSALTPPADSLCIWPSKRSPRRGQNTCAF
jgi:hypothetical protein